MLLNDNPLMTKINVIKPLPLTGVRVVEFTHMVMGPTCGKLTTLDGAVQITGGTLGPMIRHVCFAEIGNRLLPTRSMRV